MGLLDLVISAFSGEEEEPKPIGDDVLLLPGRKFLWSGYWGGQDRYIAPGSTAIIEEMNQLGVKAFDLVPDSQKQHLVVLVIEPTRQVESNRLKAIGERTGGHVRIEEQGTFDDLDSMTLWITELTAKIAGKAGEELDERTPWPVKHWKLVLVLVAVALLAIVAYAKGWFGNDKD